MNSCLWLKNKNRPVRAILKESLRSGATFLILFVFLNFGRDAIFVVGGIPAKFIKNIR